MMVTVFCSPGCGLLGRGLVAGSDAPGRRGSLFVRCRACCRSRDASDRLAAERVVVEQGEADEGDQKQAEQHRKRLRCR